MVEVLEAVCPVCWRLVAVRPDGSLRRHGSVDGGECEGGE